jgi:hypothetical protein
MRRLIFFLLAVPFIPACSHDIVTSDRAFIQFVNASPGIIVTTMVGGQNVGPNLAFGDASESCVGIPKGTQSLNFAVSNQVVAGTGAYNFEEGRLYTVLLQGTGSSRTVLVLPDNFTSPGGGNYSVKFVNASSQTGNIFVTSQSGSVGATPTVSLGGGNAVNAYMSFPSANNRIRFFGTASASTPLLDFTLSNPSSTLGTTIVFANDVTGAVTVFAVITCAV